MKKDAAAEAETCTQCGSPFSPLMRECPSCRTDLGFPNVRACQTPTNVSALDQRFEDCKTTARKRGCAETLQRCQEVIESKSGVVITMAAGFARSFFDDPRLLYTNYETLTGSGQRLPASPTDDAHRTTIASLFFGINAKSISYGALSLTNEGLPTYGEVFCRLRNVAVQKRTTFLESNSYKFVEDHKIGPSQEIPPGYRACWEDRAKLALVKLSPHLENGQTESDWQSMLLQSNGENRSDDEFIEAHLYESFNVRSIESVQAVKDKDLKRGIKIDLRLALAAFNGQRSGKN